MSLVDGRLGCTRCNVSAMCFCTGSRYAGVAVPRLGWPAVEGPTRPNICRGWCSRPWQRHRLLNMVCLATARQLRHVPATWILVCICICRHQAGRRRQAAWV